MNGAPPIFSGCRRHRLAILVANGAAQAAAVVASAWLVRALFDELRHLDPAAQLAPVLGGLIGCGLLLAGLRAAERVQAERFGQDYVAELRLALFDSLAAQAARQVHGRSRGATLLRFVGDLKSIRRWLALGLPRLVVGAVAVLIALGALATVSATLALAAAAGFALGTAAVAWTGSGIEPAVREARRRQMRLATEVNDKIAGIAVVQAFGQVGRERRRLAQHGEAMAKAMVEQAGAVAALRSAAELGGAAATVGVLWAGAVEVGTGTLGVAEVAGALALVRLTAPVFRDLGQVSGHWRAARVSFERLGAFFLRPRLLAMREDGDPAAPAIEGAAAIEFRAVCHGHVLRDFTATARPGERVAVVGPNGAGKSTLLAVAARLLDPDRGEVLLNGVAATRYPLAAVRRALGLVTPDLPLLRGSIARNLRYRWPGAPDEEVDRVAHCCGVHALAATLPAGLRTRLSEGGGNLSYGQRQRIAWARALLGRPAVLLLDEAEGGLDPASARQLSDILRAFPGTVISVTHDYRRMMEADTVWFVEAGRLMECGPPAELLSRVSRTARLFRHDVAKAG